VLQYGQGIKAAALFLGYDIPEKQLTNPFITGLPARLRERAQLLSGPFDEVVEKMSLVAAIMAANGERLFSIDEHQGRPDKPPKPALEYILIDGCHVTKKEGKEYYLHNCQQHGGQSHFARDHSHNQQRSDGQHADVQGTGNGYGGSRT
jgi:hypothetical protein